MLPTKALVLCAVLAAGTEKSCEESANPAFCETQAAKELSERTVYAGSSDNPWVCGKLNGELRCVPMIHCVVDEKSK